MSLKDTINQDLKVAMKEKNEVAKLALRAIKSAILLAETSESKLGASLTEAEELQLLIKQAKQRKDSIQQFRSNQRDDLADKEEAELKVIEQYLPQALSPEEVKAEVERIVAELGASSMKDMGRVMKATREKLAGKADGKAIADLVKQILSS
ncbi:MAG: GatB/YqeY domain-containing protein [Bacteroidota bacterium]